MANKKHIITVLLLLSFLGLYAQRPFDAQRVNVHFSKTPLKEVLNHISTYYKVQFSYGNDHLRLDEKISFYSEGKTLAETLEALFEENNILYATIGNQLVLKQGKLKDKRRKARQKRKKRREQRKQETLERGTLFDFDIHSEIIGKVEEEESPEERAQFIIPTDEIEPLIAKSIEGKVRYEETLEKESNYVGPNKYRALRTRFGQYSVFPFLSSNGRNLGTCNVLSFNMFWGINGGVNGIEIGGIGNTIKRNVHGVQLGGIFNMAKGHLHGSQFAGVFNAIKGAVVGTQVAGFWNIGSNVYGAQLSSLSNIARDLYGFQIGGLSNLATDVYGLQISGLFNFANGKLFGTQIAGFGNIAWGGHSAVQFAGVFNKAAKAQFQFASLANVAQTIDGAQIGAINVANKVSGIQFGAVNSTKELSGVQIGIINASENAQGVMIGIINVVDSIKGVPLGLINIVKRNGYNRFEFSGGDAMYVNFGGKFGSKRLYHILQGGWRIASDNTYAWSMGAGVGTAVGINRLLDFNFEFLVSHVNEEDIWTTELNLLNQIKFTLDVKIGDRVSLFLGPTFNLHVSRLYNPDTNTYGSSIMPYHFYTSTVRGTNVTLWVGINAGIRF